MQVLCDNNCIEDVAPADTIQWNILPHTGLLCSQLSHIQEVMILYDSIGRKTTHYKNKCNCTIFSQLLF